MLWSFGSLPIFKNSGLTVRGLSFLFLVKLLFSIGLVLVYTYYYTDRAYADIYKYFDDGITIHESMSEHPKATLEVMTGVGFDRNDPEIRGVLANTHHFDKKDDSFLESNHRLIIRLNSLLRFVSLGSIYIHSLFFCFLSFMGLVAMYRALGLFLTPDTRYVLLLPVFLVPSILFWSSGLLKETLVIFFLGILFFSAIKLFAMKNIIANLFLSALSLHFLFLSKPFVALGFLISFYMMGIVYFKGYLKIVSILIGISSVLWFFYAHNTFVCDIMSSIISKRNEFVALGLKMKAGSLADRDIYPLGCLIPIQLLPAGLYCMFFQPFVWSHGLFEKIFGFENLLVLLLSLIPVFYFQMPKGNRLQLAVFSFVFVSLNYTLIGVTVPIIGALVRYKIFGLLFYLVLLICFTDLNKIIFIINSNRKTDSLSKMMSKFFFK